MGICSSKDEALVDGDEIGPDGKDASNRGGPTALKVTIKCAKGLRNADWLPFGGNKSDPYCICEIPGKEGTVVMGRRVVTAVNKNDLNPTWNCEGYILDYAKGDELLFKVLDSDTSTEVEDDVLGQVVLQSPDFYPGGYEGELQLEGSQKKDARVAVKIEPCSPPEKQEPDPAAPGTAPGQRFGITFREKSKEGTLTCHWTNKPLGFIFDEGRLPLRIKKITPNSEAKALGVKVGMEMVAINGNEVLPPMKYAEAFAKLSAYIDELPEASK